MYHLLHFIISIKKVILKFSLKRQKQKIARLKNQTENRIHVSNDTFAAYIFSFLSRYCT